MSGQLTIDGRVRDEDDGEPIDVGFVGCGGHAFRNVYPTIQFADVNLVATCDLDEERARAYADQFGADRAYTDYREMLTAETVDAVFAVLDYDESGRPKYPAIATDAMEAGCDVWIEKPPAASVDEIDSLLEVEERTGQFVQIGFKKCFAPAVEQARSIVESDEFGPLNTLSVRYPQRLPGRDGRERNGRGRSIEHGPALVDVLDHVVHPGSIVSYLGGPIDTVTTQSGSGGGGFITLRFENGAVGSIHMARGSSGRSPLERVEAIGDGANVVIENGIDVTYYRPSERPAYGIATTYTGDSSDAPVSWKPEFSLGQLNNKNLFTLGYYHEVQHFAECCRSGEKPSKAGLPMAREVLQLYEAILAAEDEIVAL